MLRLLDIILSFVAILVLSPLFLVVAILLRITGEGEVFYLQSRRGKNDEEFKIFEENIEAKINDGGNDGNFSAAHKMETVKLARLVHSETTELQELRDAARALQENMSNLESEATALRTQRDEAAAAVERAEKDQAHFRNVEVELAK